VKILHVITGLYTGGAETMLAKLIERMPASIGESAVISLTGGGPIAERIAALGTPVTFLGMRRGRLSVFGFIRLVQAMRRLKPDLVQTWMYHANLTAGLAAKLAGRPPVIWGIRQSDLDPRISKWSTRAVARLGACFSRLLPVKIVCCAENARDVHAAMGYCRDRMIVIANGFDLDKFRPNPDARFALCCELGLPDSATLIAMPARFDPQKDHQSLLQAAKRLRVEMPRAHFILCGDGINSNNDTLTGWISDLGLDGAIHLLGPRNDMPNIMAACDVVVSSSAFGEGFSNTLGEAMAAATPCVTTDVGDSRLIVGDTGRIVPPRDPQALAGALGDVLRLSDSERHALGLRARERIAEHYSLDAISAQYATLYRDTTRARV